MCWQLPIKVDWESSTDGTEIATVRGWERRDWGDDGDTMHWCCTEGPEAYVGDRPVVESLADELTGRRRRRGLRRASPPPALS